jgi:YD repeat-containing protein
MKHLVIVIAALLGVATVVRPSGATTTDYQFDALGRLSTVTQGTTATTYTYDAAGNRATKQVNAVTPTAVSLTTSAGTIREQNGSVMLSASVGDSSTTGTVNFYDGATLIGTASLTNGVASITAGSLSPGTHTITVAYAGGGSSPANSLTMQVRLVNLNWLPAVLQLLLQ